MRHPSKSMPSSMWVMRVLSIDNVNPSRRRMCASWVTSASSCCRVPAMQMTKSSA
jgi:hypothetical protein